MKRFSLVALLLVLCFFGTQAQAQETLTVDNTKPEKVRTSFATQKGAIYVINASGKVSDWSGHTDGVDAVWCYAEWRCPKPELWNQLRINNQGMTYYVRSAEPDDKKIPYNPSHEYQIEFTGDGNPIEFFMLDAQGSAADNTGSIKVVITKK